MKGKEELVYNVKRKGVKVGKVWGEEDGRRWGKKEIEVKDVRVGEGGKIVGNG